jgi:hypothetical protein
LPWMAGGHDATICKKPSLFDAVAADRSTRRSNSPDPDSGTRHTSILQHCRGWYRHNRAEVLQGVHERKSLR